ncbi:hypothetical protein HDU97_002689 [Phlyctochytrium planicorne]|nr:hypothetical protein HDU97_002689 [Phlyctochytrium planicorne]
MTTNKEELVALVRSLLISDPDILRTMKGLISDVEVVKTIRDSMAAHPAPINVPGFGEIEPCHAIFNPDGSYILPSQIPPTHQMSTLHEPIPFHQPLATYNGLVKRLADLKANQETAAAKNQIVKDLERAIAADQNWLTQHPEPPAKPDSMSFKALRNMIKGKETKQKEQEEQEKINAERIVRTKSLQELKAKLEKAQIGAQLANADCVGLPETQKELLRQLDQIWGTLTTHDSAFLVSAIKEGHELGAKISADFRAFQAALSVAKKMGEKLAVALQALIDQELQPFWKSTGSSEQERLNGLRKKAVDVAEKAYVKVREDAESLTKVLASQNLGLPEFRLKVPELFLEHTFSNYLREEVDTRFDKFQNFIITRNGAICREHKLKVMAIIEWLQKSLNSMSSSHALVMADLEHKNMELNVYRMECVEMVATKESGRPKLDRADMRRLLKPDVDVVVLPSSS